MNTFNTPRSVLKTLVMSLITVGVVGDAAAMADQVGPSSLTKSVSVQDLDLSTVQGQQIARERVQKLVRTMCDRVGDPTDMSHHTNYVACVDVTLARAGEKLQALINKKSNLQFARTEVK